MPQKNVEVVRRLLALWQGTDPVAVSRDDATWLGRGPELEAIFAPDCAFAWITSASESRRPVLTGCARPGAIGYEPWESVRIEYDQVIPVGDGVLVLARQHGWIAGVQNEVELVGAAVYLVQDGSVTHAEFYSNRAEALEAAGWGD